MQETRQRSFASPSSRHGLTDAEAEVLAHLAAGLTAQSIARVRRVSPRTVLLMDR
jgi:DNA-binding CsgD family transcriptional regulator